MSRTAIGVTLWLIAAPLLRLGPSVAHTQPSFMGSPSPREPAINETRRATGAQGSTAGLSGVHFSYCLADV